jgi:hypothetical protein
MERRETGPTVILLPSEGKMCERPNEDTFGRSLSHLVVIVLVVVLVLEGLSAYHHI